jgi:fermentation-respiration switch protein FrsA (DUF1100 family)
MLFITGDKAHSREFSEDAYKRAAEPKELVIIPNAGHVDLYDKVGLIPLDKLEAFFKQHLKENNGSKTVQVESTISSNDNVFTK